MPSVAHTLFRSVCAATCLALATTHVLPQEKAKTQCTDDVMLVFDGSGSMASMGFNGLDQPRIIDARKALRSSLPYITPYRRLGLIVYGPGPQESCNNVDLRFKPVLNAGSKVMAEIERLRPDGETPLTSAVRSAADVLKTQNESGVVVLVTDGKETCGGATCQLAAELAATAENITVHVVGFKVRGDFFNWKSADKLGLDHGRTVARCLADMTGGKYVSTESADELAQALRETLACPIVGMTRSWN